MKLDLTEHITHMLLTFFPSSATILLVVWSANDDGIVLLLLPRQVPRSIYYVTKLTDTIN